MKLAVLTSGGDAPGMNSAIRATAKVCAGRGILLEGVELGFEGLIDGRFRPLTRSSGVEMGRGDGRAAEATGATSNADASPTVVRGSVDERGDARGDGDPRGDGRGERSPEAVGGTSCDEGSPAARTAELTVHSDVERCGGWGGTILGSARSERFRSEAGRREAAEALRARGTDGLIVIGGNGSLTGAHHLAREHGVRVVGVPASIDNDIGCTSMSLGVDTALNTIIDACDRIADTASAHRRAFVIEVMGRDCGYLAMASAIAAGADAVLMREQGRSDDEVVAALERTIRTGFERGKLRVLVIKSEGVRIPCTKLVRELNERIEGDHVRATVLGHVVRGGRASYQDRRIASRLAFQAVEAFANDLTGTMVAWQPSERDGLGTLDPSVKLFPLERVIDVTRAVHDGTSPAMQWRLAMMERVAGVLGV